MKKKKMELENSQEGKQFHGVAVEGKKQSWNRPAMELTTFTQYLWDVVAGRVVLPWPED